MSAPASRFDLILQLIEVNATATQLTLANDADSLEAWGTVESLYSTASTLGYAWAKQGPPEGSFRLPALIADLQRHTSGVWANEMVELGDYFYNGFRDAQHQACVFPKPRPLDARPPHLLAENDHFWLTNHRGGFCMGSKNVSGGFGEVHLPPSVLGSTLRKIRHRDIWMEKHWRLADPYGMNAPTQVLLRDDLTAGWDDDDQDPFPSSWKHHSDTLGELSLLVEHPGQGQLHFGAPAQEAEQLQACLELLERALVIQEEYQSPERLAAAEQRAKAINTAASVSFLPFSGFCHRCHADVTLALSPATAASHITGCPLCGATWCD